MRLMLFTNDVPVLARYYVDTFGLSYLGDPEDTGWIEVDAGGVRLAFPGSMARKALGGKIVFFADDVVETRQQLMERGIEVGAVQSFRKLAYCDFSDPAGNRVQISNRP